MQFGEGFYLKKQLTSSYEHIFGIKKLYRKIERDAYNPRFDASRKNEMNHSFSIVCVALCVIQTSLFADQLKPEAYFDDILSQEIVEEMAPLQEEQKQEDEKLPTLEEAPVKLPTFLKSDDTPPFLSSPEEKTPEILDDSLSQVEKNHTIQQEPPPEITIEVLPQLQSENLSSMSLPETRIDKGYNINFTDVSMEEFVRFVSKISEVNFIFDRKELNFNVSLTSGKPVSAENVLNALLRILRMNGFWIKKEDEYFVIHKVDQTQPPDRGWDAFLYDDNEPAKLLPIPDPVAEEIVPKEIEVQEVTPAEPEIPLPEIPPSLPLPVVVEEQKPFEFFVYKLKYHQGSDIKEALKQVALELQTQPGTPQKLLSAIHTVQWVQATNSLLCSGDEETLLSLKKLIESVDTALKQVFIEVLVIETDVSNGLEFGLEWGASGQLKKNLGVGAGGAPPSANPSLFSKSMQGINALNHPSGLSQFPVGSGFDLGVIGDIIFHKGKSFLSLGALVSALQQDGGSTIVLNQKIIAQDNKPSQIFVGDNIPFTGSVTQLVGQSQQTTSNIEYRDIGVNLNIKPMIGDDGVITLDIQEEISETVNQPGVNPSSAQPSGIRTTKTNMVTHVHVPDKHFLVLSGMIRNANSSHKSGLPCLGGIPFIGSLFSKKVKQEEKRNVIIFVRPNIIQSMADYQKVTTVQNDLHRNQTTDPKDFDAGLKLIPPMEE